MEQSECVSFDDDDDAGEETLEDDVEMDDAKLLENGRVCDGEADSVIENGSGIGGGRGDGVGGSEDTCNNGGGGGMRDNATGEPRRKWKKRIKKCRGSPTFNITCINRFVLDTCRRFQEQKSYLVWYAVGCLGFSAMMDLVKEVDAIQYYGGQKTADGKKLRTGGGILWNIMKNRNPTEFKEIMAKGKELEYQIFRQPQKKQSSNNNVVVSQAQNLPHCASEHSISDSSDKLPFWQNQETSKPRKRRLSVLERIRVPVAYDDLLEEGEILPVACNDLLEEDGEIIPIASDDLLEKDEISQP